MHPKIAFLILSAFAAMTMAAPQNPTETPADVEGAITAQDIAQALPVGTVHQLADGEPEVSIAAVERTHVKVCKDINFRGRCETLTANKQRCCESIQLTISQDLSMMWGARPYPEADGALACA